MQIQPRHTHAGQPFIFECSACECVEHRGVPFLPAGWSFHILDGRDTVLCTDCTPDENELELEHISPELERSRDLQAATAELASSIRAGKPFLVLCIVLGVGVSLFRHAWPALSTALA